MILKTPQVPLLCVLLILSGCSSFSGILEDPMTVEDRVSFNSGPFFDECVFNPQGEPLRKPCVDLRLKPTSLPPGMYNESLEYAGEALGLNHHVYSTVSETEVVCFKLLTESQGYIGYYPRACKVDNDIHYTIGDTVAMLHETCHSSSHCEH